MTLSREEIETGIREVAAAHLPDVASMHGDARLVDDLDLDSLELLTLSFEIENHFDVDLEPGAESVIITVADLADTIERLLRRASDDLTASERGGDAVRSPEADLGEHVHP